MAQRSSVGGSIPPSITPHDSEGPNNKQQPTQLSNKARVLVMTALYLAMFLVTLVSFAVNY